MVQLKAVSEADLPEVAKALLDLAGGIRTFTFEGELGAGKTALIKMICKELGVEDATSSPTFAIVNEYKCADGTPIAHMDLYRLKDHDEFLQAGLQEYFDDNTYCFVEWPEKFFDILPLERVAVRIAVDEGNRWIEARK